jgi:hypothetical protein
LVVAVFNHLALGLAHPGETYAAKAIEVAGRSVLDRNKATASIREVTGVIGASVLVIAHDAFAEMFFARSIDAEPIKTVEVAPCVVLDWNVVAPTGYGVARIVGALIAVVAYAVVAEALRAEAGRTEAGKKAFVLADRSVVRRHAAPAGVRIANVVDAFIAVVFADDAFAEVAVAAYTHAGSAMERAARSVFDPAMVTRRTVITPNHTPVPGARVAVAATHTSTRVHQTARNPHNSDQGAGA